MHWIQIRCLLLLVRQSKLLPATFLSSFANYHKANSLLSAHDAVVAKKLFESGITPGDVVRTTDNEQVKSMATPNDLDALGFNALLHTPANPCTDGAGICSDILLAPGDSSCFGADVDLLLNLVYGDNVAG